MWHSVLRIPFSSHHGRNRFATTFITPFRSGKYWLCNLSFFRSFHTISIGFSFGEYGGRKSRNRNCFWSSSHWFSNFAWWYLALSRMIWILFPFPLFFRTVRNLLNVMALNTFDTTQRILQFWYSLHWIHWHLFWWDTAVPLDLHLPVEPTWQWWFHAGRNGTHPVTICPYLPFSGLQRVFLKASCSSGSPLAMTPRGFLLLNSSLWKISWHILTPIYVSNLIVHIR